jgi:GTP cyclohydrolase II
MVHNGVECSNTDKSFRQTVSLPAPTAKRVHALAKTRRTSANRVLVELIESGLESKEAEKRRFFELTEQLAASIDAEEQHRIKQELRRMTFGE